jgi:hypothetical protein
MYLGVFMAIAGHTGQAKILRCGRLSSAKIPSWLPRSNRGSIDGKPVSRELTTVNFPLTTAAEGYGSSLSIATAAERLRAAGRGLLPSTQPQAGPVRGWGGVWWHGVQQGGHAPSVEKAV